MPLCSEVGILVRNLANGERDVCSRQKHRCSVSCHGSSRQSCLRQLRLDHFRALAAYWAVPGQDKTAENVEWQPMPGRSLLNKLK